MNPSPTGNGRLAVHPNGLVDDGLEKVYLDLLKKSLTCALYPGMGGANWEPKGLRGQLLKLVLPPDVQVQRVVNPARRANGSDWPATAQTMIGSKRLDNLQACVETVLRDDVPGDFIETGVWRGGACILIRGILGAHRVTDRNVWLADSFEGLPKPNAEKYPADAGDRHYQLAHLAVSLEEVRENFRRYGLLDEQVKFLKGWFKDTLPTAPIEKLAVARLDGDLYESTTDALENLYAKLTVGGFLIVDDYGAVPACKRATEDFRARENIREEIKRIDETGVYWRRER